MIDSYPKSLALFFTQLPNLWTKPRVYLAITLCRLHVELSEFSSPLELWTTALQPVQKPKSRALKSGVFNLLHRNQWKWRENTFAQFVPATKQDTSLPSLLAAVMAFRVIGVSVSLLCSATTRVLWNLWIKPDWKEEKTYLVNLIQYDINNCQALSPK